MIVYIIMFVPMGTTFQADIDIFSLAYGRRYYNLTNNSFIDMASRNGQIAA